MFFGASQVIQYILGAVALMHLHDKDNCSQNLTEKNLDDKFKINEYLIGLIFKPISGTIDLVIMNMDGDDCVEKNLISDFFKVISKTKKLKKMKK